MILASPGETERLKSRLSEAERVLRASYSVILPRILAQHVDSRLGFQSPSWTRSERGHSFYVDLSKDLGQWWKELVRDEHPTGAQIARVERRHREDAVAELVGVVRRMPTSVRSIVEMRACGVSWRRLMADLPGRSYFSAREDWDRACATLLLRHEDLVRRIGR